MSFLMSYKLQVILNDGNNEAVVGVSFKCKGLPIEEQFE